MKRLLILAAVLAASAATPALAAPAKDAAPAAACNTPVAPVVMGHVSICDIGKRGAPVLVLVPGLASPRAVWDGVVPMLAATHRLLIVQVNGFGGDAPGDNLTPGILDGIVADLDAYLAKNKLSGVAYAGHSMGGLVGLMLAKAHPGDVGKLMIVDSLPYFAVLMAPPGVDPTPAMIAPVAGAMRDSVAAAYGKPADPATLAAQTRGLALKPESIAKMTTWAASADPRVTGQAMYEDLTTDLRPDLAGIRTPITLVYPWNAGGPGKDKVDAFYRKQYAGAPQISYVAIPDAAHFVMLDQPAAFEVALSAFLSPK